MLRGWDTIRTLLADDDADDNMLFSEALRELPFDTRLTVICNGDQLLKHLNEQVSYDLLFLDLNMPRKNGLQCLTEIKNSEKLKHLPVIILTTTSDAKFIDLLYKAGANRFIRKPNSYVELKSLIWQAIILLETVNTSPSREQFVLKAQEPTHVN
jgi:CheY-like chemotaxis protein